MVALAGMLKTQHVHPRAGPVQFFGYSTDPVRRWQERPAASRNGAPDSSPNNWLFSPDGPLGRVALVCRAGI